MAWPLAWPFVRSLPGGSDMHEAVIALRLVLQLERVPCLEAVMPCR